MPKKADIEQMKKDVQARLKKIEGQVRGVQKMVDEQRSCGDITVQLSAIKAAVSQVGITVLGCHLAGCIEDGIKEGRDIGEIVAEFAVMFKRFS